MRLRTWPEDDVEHELETLSQWLRTNPECPAEVRIREQEGTFMRPSILIRHDALGYVDGGRYYWQDTRACNIMWYGSEPRKDAPDFDFHLEKNRALSWLRRQLTRETDVLRGVLPIYDFSLDTPFITDYWIVITDDSVSVTPRKDEYGLWYVTASFDYMVERGPVDPAGTPVTGVQYSYEVQE